MGLRRLLRKSDIIFLHFVGEWERGGKWQEGPLLRGQSTKREQGAPAPFVFLSRLQTLIKFFVQQAGPQKKTKKQKRFTCARKELLDETGVSAPGYCHIAIFPGLPFISGTKVTSLKLYSNQFFASPTNT